MADPRTFVLIGEFKDGITPELQKINNQLASLKNSFSTLGGKGARNASRDIGRFKGAVESLNDTLKTQSQVLRSTIEPMRQYRREVGKTVGALKKLDEAGGRSIAIERTNKALAEQIRLMDQLRSRTGRGGYARPPRGGGGGGYVEPPRRGGGGSRSAGGGMGAHMAEFGFAFTLGNAIAQPVQNAIVQGFQIGVDLMTKPFQYFANAFGERVQDEISDLKAAGGFLSISKRSQNPFVKNIDEAIQFQQETNETFAKMAAALPGVTNDYVQVGKRLGDTAARIVNQDFKGALEEANRIRQTEEGRKFYGGQIKATGPEAQREVIETLLGELTKKTTIAGLGGRSGAGGIAGAYGLPGLTERMLSQQEVSMGQFQRYAAVFSDPTISDALQRNIEKINATQMNSVERFKAIQKLLDEVVTPELIEKLRTSVDGVYQGLKSVIFDPDTGLFGLGRNFKAFGKRMNQYGQYVDKAGKVVENIAQAADEDLSIFEIVRDIFSNFGQALLPLVESLQLVFDPLKSVANVLMDARHYAGEFNKVFNQYRQGLLELSKTKSDAFKNTVDIRASLSAINAFLKNFGVITEADFKNFGAQLMSENLDIGKMISTLIDKVLNSKIAEDIGNLIGKVIGTVLTEVAKVTGFISGRVAGTNKLFDGIKAGFEEAGGVQALKNIFSDVFKTLFKVLIEVMKLIPVEGYMIMAAMVVIPAAIQGLGMKIAEGVLGGITRLGDILKADIPKQLAKNRTTRGISNKVTGAGFGEGIYGGGPQRYGRGGSIERLNRMRRARYARGAAAARANMAYAAEPFVNYAKTSRVGQGAMGFAKGAGKLARGAGKLVPGGALAMGAVDMGLALASGEGFGKAAAGTLGTVIGASIGTIFGPAGTMIGGIAGNMIGDALFTNLTAKGPSVEQLHAAEMQNEAAVKQLQAAQLQRGGLDPDKATYTFGTAEQFGDRLKVLGLDADKAGIALKGLYSKREAAAKAADKAAKELNKKIKDLKDNEVPDDLIAKQVKPLQEQFNKAKKNLERSQAEFDAQFRKTPEIIQRSITNSLSALSFKSIESILANKIAGLNIQAPRNPLTLPNPYDTAPEVKIPDWSNAYDNPFKWEQKPDPNKPSPIFRAKGGLGDAIASEMRMKPPGSDLVIANSSETVIPAAGGYGMKTFIDTLATGFSAVKQSFQIVGEGIKQSDQNSQKRDQQTNTKITDYHNQTQSQILKLTQNLSQLSTQVSTMSSMGGMMGGAGMALGGGYGGAGVQIAGQLGNFIKKTGGAPGSIHEHPMHGGVRGKHAPGSYHYSGRAIDIGAYANEQAGVIARIKQFNAQMGVKPVEFLHAGNDPNHQDHVHVAYAFGRGNPAFFSSQRAAENWEASMAGRMNVRTVTGNTTEGFGGNSVGDIYVTVNAGATADPDQLAYMVAERIQEAVGQAVNANILV